MAVVDMATRVLTDALVKIRELDPVDHPTRYASQLAKRALIAFDREQAKARESTALNSNATP